MMHYQSCPQVDERQLAPKSSRLAFLGVSAICGLAALAGSCRSAQRGMRVGGETVELKVTMNGLRSGDTERGEWIYELSTCIPATVGVLGENNVLSFKAAGLKKDMIDCQLRVKLPTEAPANYDFGANADRTLLYWARAVSTHMNATGTLEATASLEPLFNLLPADQSKIYTVKVPVEWPTVEAGTASTAQMSCAPTFSSIGFYTSVGEKTGVYSFNWTDKEPINYRCTILAVRASVNYRAELGEGGKFSIAPGDKIELPKVTLVQENATVTPPPSGDITIDLPSEASKCKDNEKFDIAKRSCVPR